jgi:Tfp pilus assembly pilus retraction ATPase PilT
MEAKYNCKQAKYLFATCYLLMVQQKLARSLAQGGSVSISDLLENTPIVKTNIWTDDAGFTLSVKQ